MEKFRLPLVKLSGSFIALMFMFLVITSCNKEENVQPPLQEDLPDLVTALESFDEEVEYSDAEGENARWGAIKKKKPTFFTLAAALKYTGLFIPVVQNRLTVFAPTDEAFNELGINLWNIRKQDKDFLTSVILYHAAAGFIYSNDLPACSLAMLDGSFTGFKYQMGKVFINDATDDFAQVIFTDKKALNSVFHGIDKVLIPPTETIAGIASGNDNFDILVGLLGAANLAGVVNDPDQNLTVFAPTDAAFKSLTGLTDEDEIIEAVAVNPLLTEILLHHVAAGSTFSFCLTDGQSIPTLNEDNLTVDLGNLELSSSSGNVAGLVPGLLDIHANNGVIHVINAVLLPAPKP